MSLARRTWFLCLLFGLLVFATRYPFAPGQLFTSDDVNLAYSIGRFDVRVSQPQPPGYPLFVLEMRVLYWLRIRRPESILLALSLAGSLAALLLVARCGQRILGGDTGYCAAWLLVLHPVFWHAGLTSALRVQLAVVSAAVALACWRAWSGETGWVWRSAVVLGLGAGISPELGPLLFPLWAVGALRARISWKERGKALGAMALAVLVWVAAILASGGPYQFIKATLDFISAQASVSLALLGAPENTWHTTFWRLMVWVFCSVPAWGLPVVLAWRRGELLPGWGLGWNRIAFLTLWFLPPFVFAFLVHVEEPGQTLAAAPAVALFGGYLMDRALANVEERVSRWYATAFVLATLAVAWIVDRRSGPDIVVWVPVVCIAAGVMLRLAETRNTGHPARWQMSFFMLAPVVVLDLTMFNHPGWYYKGSATKGLQAAYEAAKADLTSGLALTSYEQVHNTLALDDGTVRGIRRLAGERPGRTVVIWERGLTAWRKAAYYAPGVPVLVLDHTRVQSGSPPAVAVWKGPRLESMLQGAAPLRIAVPAGGRIVWLLNPRTDFYQLAAQAFPLITAYPVYYSDLPQESGSRTLGGYEVAW